MKNILYISLFFSLLFTLGGCQTTAEKKLNDNADKRAMLHYQLGLDAIHKGLISKAFEELYLSDKIRANQPDTLDAIAYAWRLRGDNKKAESFYKRAIKHNAGPATYNNYGSLLVETGRYKKALNILNQALEDPRYRNQALVFINMGDAYVGLKDLDNAVRSYRKAGMLSAHKTYTQLKEAAAYKAFNRLNYAQALYETILHQEPANQEALQELIILLKANGKRQLLRHYIQTFIQKSSNKLQQTWAKDELLKLDKGQ